MERLTFLAPIAGLIASAIGSGLVLLMYMLKLRRRPVLVSSTMLWKRAVRDLEGNIPWQRLSPTMLLFLHLLIVLLLAFAIARPVADTGLGNGQRVAIVIDTSASMNAIGNDRSALAMAQREASDRVRTLFDSGRSPRVSVVEAGLEPRVVLRDSSERGRVLGAIEGLEPSDQAGDLIEAIGLLEGLIPESVDEDATVSEQEPMRVWLLSDGDAIEGGSIPMRGGNGQLIPVVPEGLRSNLGIVALSAQRDRVETELCRVFVRVRRSASGPAAGVLRVFDGDELIESAPIAFEQGLDSTTHTFEMRLMRSALLRVQLAGEDALSSDDRAWVGVTSPDPIRVTVVAPQANADPLLIDYLEVIARAPVRVIADGEAIGNPDLVVFDRVDVRSLPPIPSIGFGSATPGLSVRLAQPSGIRRALSWERDDPILRDTGIGSVSYVSTLRFDESGAGVRVLARDQDGAVLIEAVEAGIRHVRASFALHDSDWAVQVGFTVLLAQLCEKLLPGAGGSGDVFRTSDVIAYRDEQGIERVVGPFRRIGVQTLPDGRTIGVSLLDEDESALRSTDQIRIGSATNGTAGSGSDLAGGRVRTDLWRWFVGAAIALLMVEWLLYLQRVRIATD